MVAPPLFPEFEFSRQILSFLTRQVFIQIAEMQCNLTLNPTGESKKSSQRLRMPSNRGKKSPAFLFE